MDIRPLPFRDAATATPAEVLAALRTDAAAGLTAAEAEARRAVTGANEVARSVTHWRDVLLRQMTSPFLALLAGAAVIAAATGEPVDAAMITLFMAINTALGFFQEYRAERAVESLMTYWHEKTHVLRAGAAVRIDSRDLVVGDVVRLQAGDKIPADVRFLRTEAVTVDESVLTGESIAVAKGEGAMLRAPAEHYEAANVGFSGTAVLTGEADAVVIATGHGSALGEIAALAGDTRAEGVFERQIGAFSRFVLKLVIVTLAFVFALNIGLKGVGNAEELLLFCIALTVGVIPEALPVVSTVAMARGAQRMARRQVIVKRLSAIDDLGSIDVLCTDKTGTITQNVMQVTEVRAKDQDECARLALLGSSFLGEGEKQQNNAFDAALWRQASTQLRRECAGYRKIAEIPFDPVARRNAVLVEAPDGECTLIVRGAPDAVLPLCDDHGIGDRLALGKHLAAQGLAGNRVLAVGVRRHVPPGIDIEELHDDLDFAGTVSFHDPLKPDAIDAARRAAAMGVRIKILTGDSKEVAASVGQKLGLIESPLDVLSGAEFDALAPEDRAGAAHRTHVFARMNPTQKFAVLSILERDHSVGFLGEGFNDAPGLKIANVGLAVEGASDVAKEAADVVLLNKGLGVIFDGIEEGRRTFANTIKYLRITLAGNFGNFYAVAAASFFIPFLPMRPVQILLVNLLTDVPMIALAADAVDGGDLKNPRKYDARQVILAATVLGLVSSAFDLATFAVFRGDGEPGLQTMWFVVSILTELALIFSLRTTQPFWKSARPPSVIALLAIAAALIAVALPFTDVGREAFGFVPPNRQQFGTALTIVLLFLVATEAVKLQMSRFTSASVPANENAVS